MANNLTCPDSCPHLEEVADVAVCKAFAVIGIDINDPKNVEEFRQDLRFGSAMHRLAKHGAMTMVGLLVTAIFAVIFGRLFGGI